MKQIIKAFRKLEEKRQVQFIMKDTILVSYPKSGRTWVRMMLAKLLVEMGHSNEHFEMLPALHAQPEHVINKFSRDVRVIFLYRNIGDVAMSFFWESALSDRNGIAVHRAPSAFIRDARYGIPNIAAYYNLWFDNVHKFKDHLFVTYEDLHNDTISTMMEIVKFFNVERTVRTWDYEAIDSDTEPPPKYPDHPLKNFTMEKLRNAIEYSKFENMRKIERGAGSENLLKYYKGNFGDIDIWSNPEKKEVYEKMMAKAKPDLIEFIKEKNAKDMGRIRKGKVNGYIDDLSDEDLMYVKRVESVINFPDKK